MDCVSCGTWADMSDVKNLCICASSLTFWTPLFTPAVTVAPRCTLLKWKHLPHRFLNFYPVLPSQHHIKYLWNPFQSFWHKHKPQSASLNNSRGLPWPLGTRAFEYILLLCVPGGDNLGCITHGSSEVPSRTETPDNLSGGEFSKTSQIVSWSLFNSLQHPTLILRYNLSK